MTDLAFPDFAKITAEGYKDSTDNSDNRHSMENGETQVMGRKFFRRPKALTCTVEYPIARHAEFTAWQEFTGSNHFAIALPHRDHLSLVRMAQEDLPTKITRTHYITEMDLIVPGRRQSVSV